MFRRFFNSEAKSVTGAAILIASTTLLSRFIGIIRDRTFAHYYGAGEVMDAYYAAFKIPDLIYSLLIAGALTAGFIPTFTRLFFESEDKSKAWKLANNVISIVGVSLSVLSALGVAFAPWLVKTIAPGFNGAQTQLVLTFTRIMMLSPLILGVSMVVGGILQSLRQFLLYSIAPLFYNLGIIIGAIFFSRSSIGISGLAWGVVLGAILHLLVQSFGAYLNGYRWRWHFDLKDQDTRLIGKLMIPRTMGLAVQQVNLVIITILASLLPLGSITVFNYASNLHDVPTGIIGIPFALAIFPILSRLSAAQDLEEFGERIGAVSRQIIFLVVPLSVCMMLLRAQIVRVVLGTGEFNWTATIQTADALAAFALGLFAQSLIPLFARAFYALNNTVTPFVVSVITELLCIIGSLLLMRPLGVAGLALANSAATIFGMAALAVILQRKVRTIFDENFLPFIFKIIASALVMGLVVQMLKYPLARVFDQHYFWGILSQGLFAGILGLLLYGFLCYKLKVEEVMHFQDSLKRRWLRLWNVGEGIDEAEKL